VVEENLDKVFESSDGAVVFKGAEEEGLHTRVFINSDGLPTYEAKELGLAKIKFDEFPYDQSIVVTGNEIQAYFKVLLKAMSLVFPDLAAKTKHVAHGMLRLPTGKMSSRTGDVITAEFLLAEAMKAREDVTEPIAVAAIKYSILKQAPGRDIIFDLEKSLSFLGDSGPYLQYTAVRAQAIISKAPNLMAELAGEEPTAAEKLLIRFPDLAAFAAQELAPNYIVTYLLELASAFNAYYAQNRIIGSGAENYRLALTAAVAQVLKNGLELLGIQTPDKM
jgi:arginyl-tRNA synthetase